MSNTGIPREINPLSPPTYDQATATTPPTAQQPTHTVVIIHPNETLPLGPTATSLTCPYCHNYIRTRIKHTPTNNTHLIALILCLLQLYCCICLPYCIAGCMATGHYCGMCNKYLGTYKP